MKKIPTTRLRTSFIIIALASFSGCGQKGPLILEQLPVDPTQATLENSIDQIPLETPAQAADESATTESATKEATKSE